MSRQRQADASRQREEKVVALLDQAEVLHQRVAEVLQAARRRLSGREEGVP